MSDDRLHAIRISRPEYSVVSALLDAEFALIQIAVNSKLNKDCIIPGTEARRRYCE